MNEQRNEQAFNNEKEEDQEKNVSLKVKAVIAFIGEKIVYVIAFVAETIVYGIVFVTACYITLLLASFSFQNVDSTSKNPSLATITTTRFLSSASLPAPTSSHPINASASLCDVKNKSPSPSPLFLGSKTEVKNKRQDRCSKISANQPNLEAVVSTADKVIEAIKKVAKQDLEQIDMCKMVSNKKNVVFALKIRVNNCIIDQEDRMANFWEEEMQQVGAGLEGLCSYEFGTEEIDLRKKLVSNINQAMMATRIFLTSDLKRKDFLFNHCKRAVLNQNDQK